MCKIPLMTRNLRYFLIALIALSSAPVSLAAQPAQAHATLSAHLDNAFGHAKEVRSEVSKKKKMNRERLKQELQALRTALREAETSYRRIAAESPGDAQEGHFIALGAHRDSADRAAGRIQEELTKKDPDYAAMKKLAKGVVADLEDARHEHGLELHEIEN